MMLSGSSMERRLLFSVAKRCPKSIGWLLAFLAGFAIHHVKMPNVRESVLLTASRQGIAFDKSFQSAWYGTKTYPTVTSRNESWEWLLTFMQSVSAIRVIADVEKEAVSMIKAFGKTEKNRLSVASVRFPKTSILPVEEQIADLASSVDVINIPRYECSNKLCPVILQDNRPLPTRLEFPTIPQRKVVLINFLHCDGGDTVRVIDRITGSAEFLVTALRTENADQAKDDNYALLMYELFHKMFFDYKWSPVVANWKHCEKQRYGCHLWILWMPWNFKNKAYMPPAGNGAAASEVIRINRFFTNPHTEVCHLKQGMGGSDANYDFADGTWSICLDTLQKVTPSTCLVYSFGIANDFSFDDSMHKFGCSVHSFDPSINLKAHQRNTNHWFYPWGLGNPQSGWILMTLDKIRKELNHTERPLTILKLDIETYEWAFFGSPDLEENVKDVEQLTFETHPPRRMDRNPIELALYLHLLEKLGFTMYNARQNPHFADARVTESHPLVSSYLYEPAYIRK